MKSQLGMLPWQGLPFCVAGVGDLLALFRCISCRYCFGTDATKPDMLGAPGRVFTTQEVGSAPNSAISALPPPSLHTQLSRKPETIGTPLRKAI